MSTLKSQGAARLDGLSEGPGSLVDESLYFLEWSRLPAEEQRFMRWIEVEGRSYADVAGDLGLSVEAVRAEVFRVRRSLFLGEARLRGLLDGATAERS